LNIGFLASATSSFLPEIIRKFTAKFSNVNIRLFEGNPNEQRFKLESGDLDLAFTRSLKMSPNFKKITLLQDELMIARPLTFRSKQNAEQPKTDNHVESIYIISPEVAEETYFASIQQLRRIELKISRVVTVKDYHSAIISVEAGLGIALLPSCIEKIFKHRLSFIPISHPEKVDLDLVYRPDKKKAIRDFVRFVSSELKSII
jgi:DNA-binding transcriptional LysR family regulator